MSGFAVAGDRYDRQAVRRVSGWARDYLRKAALADFGCAIIGVFVAAQLRFGNDVTSTYIALSLALPVLWLAALWLSGGYDVRFVGTGSDEFRKVLNAGVGLTAALALFSYAINLQLSRAYVLIALPTTTVFDLVARYAVRKRLHSQRASGRCMLSVVAVGHEQAVANLVNELGRDPYHGLTVVGACVAQPTGCPEVAGVPVYGGLDDVTAAVHAFGADTVAVLACPEMNGIKLRSLAWELEKTGTDLCVSPALLDVAGPRTTIRPTAGLTLLHVDHPQLSGVRLVIKGLFDRCAAAIGADPALAAADPPGRDDLAPRPRPGAVHAGPGGQGRPRVPDLQVPHHGGRRRAAQEELLANNDSDGVLFKIRNDPRITAVGVICGAGRSTSCRNCSTCCSATCHW